jgi:hypothetical protein
MIDITVPRGETALALRLNDTATLATTLAMTTVIREARPAAAPPEDNTATTQTNQ